MLELLRTDCVYFSFTFQEHLRNSLNIYTKQNIKFNFLKLGSENFILCAVVWPIQV
jgi:hypothetical protein